MPRKPIKRNFYALTASWILMRPMGRARLAYFSLFAIGLGATPAQVGLITAGFSAAVAVSRLLGGYLADSIGRKRILVPMTLVFGMTNLIFAVAKSWSHLLVANMIRGAALLYQPALDAIMADSLPSRIRARYMSFSDTVTGFSTLFGTVLAAWAVSQRGIVDGVRFFFVISIPAYVAGTLLRMMLVETRRGPREAFSFRRIARNYAEVLPLIKGDVGRVLAIRSVGRAIIMMVDPFLQIYAVSVLSLTPEQWALVFLIYNVVSLVSQPLSGYLADKVGRKEAIAAGFACRALGYGGLLLSTPGRMAHAVVALSVGALLPTRPAFFAISADVAPSPIRGRVIAMGGLMTDSLSAATRSLGGGLYEASPAGMIASTCISAGAVAAVSALVLPSKKRPS